MSKVRPMVGISSTTSLSTPCGFCRLDNLSHVPTSPYISAIGDAAVLLLRVRDDSVHPLVAAATVSLLDLKLVITVGNWMHQSGASPMGRVLKDRSVSPPSPGPNLTVTPVFLRHAHRFVALDRAA
jgi:hypothetical protein